MIQFERIKAVIWDLDETFWQGTFSEGNVLIPEQNRQLIKDLTDKGIINSICSKNDWQKIKNELNHQGLLEYFVFPSVNWEAKGNRVKQQIESMQLRAANVLFLDDNHSNREEVRFFCPEIMVEGPEAIPELAEKAAAGNKKDPEHKRLKQYRVLEEKQQQKAQYSSNEAFLEASSIRVEIGSDCLNQIERIHDLLKRANQLNFTKVRSTQEELRALIEDQSVRTGYCSVSDRFGEYGIVGFFAVKDEKLIHFVFSCRTLGMGIEQYMYHELGCPQLEIVGEVISDLSGKQKPHWINQDQKSDKGGQMKIDGLDHHMVLVKGPCDLFQVYPYIAQNELFDTEFTYVADSGLVVESTGHTTNIVEALRLSKNEKHRVLDEVPFTDSGMYSDCIYHVPYKVVFLSILADANLGVYRRKETGERFAFLEYIHPITDKRFWPDLINGTYNTAGYRFTQQLLQDFAAKYEFIGRNTPKQILENLQYIRAHLPADCQLAVMLGGELYYEKNTFEAYQDRHVVHRQINELIRAWAAEAQGVCLLDVNRYLVDQSSFYDHFNHYVKPVYYQIAKEMVEIVNMHTGSSIRQTSKLKILQIRLKEALAPTYYKVRKLLKKDR
ncbi:MAG: HAD-IIIC family phosphatase [Clostridia bacterium]|nr:HAD-IIIC family phosphatase [Clostridia bacterium]